MNDLNILLPCGFYVKYKEIYLNRGAFRCPICKTHQLTVQECLDIKKNKFILSQKRSELKKKQFLECMKQIQMYCDDFNNFIELSHKNLKNEIYFRKEKIKLNLSKKIDDYCDDLIKKVDVEQNLKFKEFDKKIQLLNSIEQETVKLDNEKKLDKAINLVTSVRDNLNEVNFKLTKSNSNIDIEDLFGQLYLKEETRFSFNEDEIDADNRSEATINLVINDFSKFLDKENFKFYSKQCRLANMEWSIYTKLMNNENGKMTLGFYLKCTSIEGLSRYPVKVTSLFSLLDESNPLKHLTKSFEYSVVKQMCCGFRNFIEINELIDPGNGYYNSDKDSIYLKASIKIELSEYEIFKI